MHPAGSALGIMGGTFDPIHYGHLVTAEVARHAFGLEQVVFVPSRRPPHKEGQKVTDPEHRYLMTVLATIDNPAFRVSRVEVERPGNSYTVDTVREFRRAVRPQTELFFITGADAIMEILTWREPKELLGMCRFIAATRPGYPLEALMSLIRTLNQGSGCRVEPLEVPALAISSSDIRRRVARGEPIRYLVPGAVENYIIKNGLYRGEEPGRGAGS
ncbi:MAG: nicotinate-nucleotide adenylyltransferase [Acetobacteraceae bacterium]|nr:nicotinate-nucleotide adenylyltransferase [Acetobacteraceae bacterium]